MVVSTINEQERIVAGKERPERNSARIFYRSVARVTGNADDICLTKDLVFRVGQIDL